MSIEPYVILDGTTVANVVDVDVLTPAGSAYVEAVGAINVSAITPQPGIGWSTQDSGLTFSAPATRTAAPTSESISISTVAGMALNLPGLISQAQADAATIATLIPGQPIEQNHIDVLVRWGYGWVTILQGLQALVQSEGVLT